MAQWLEREGCQSTSLPQSRYSLEQGTVPMLPWRCEWLSTAPVYDICRYECVTMSTVANLDGLKAEENFCVYA